MAVTQDQLTREGGEQKLIQQSAKLRRSTLHGRSSPRPWNLAASTLWRWRKAGMLNTINVYGRQYILRSEIARFNERAVTGEFARTVTPIRIKNLANK